MSLRIELDLSITLARAKVVIDSITVKASNHSDEIMCESKPHKSNRRNDMVVVDRGRSQLSWENLEKTDYDTFVEAGRQSEDKKRQEAKTYRH